MTTAPALAAIRCRAGHLLAWTDGQRLYVGSVVYEQSQVMRCVCCNRIRRWEPGA